MTAQTKNSRKTPSKAQQLIATATEQAQRLLDGQTTPTLELSSMSQGVGAEILKEANNRTNGRISAATVDSVVSKVRSTAAGLDSNPSLALLQEQSAKISAAFGGMQAVDQFASGDEIDETYRAIQELKSTSFDSTDAAVRFLGRLAHTDKQVVADWASSHASELEEIVASIPTDQKLKIAGAVGGTSLLAAGGFVLLPYLAQSNDGEQAKAKSSVRKKTSRRGAVSSVLAAASQKLAPSVQGRDSATMQEEPKALDFTNCTLEATTSLTQQQAIAMVLSTTTKQGEA